MSDLVWEWEAWYFYNATLAKVWVSNVRVCGILSITRSLKYLPESRVTVPRLIDTPEGVCAYISTPSPLPRRWSKLLINIGETQTFRINWRQIRLCELLTSISLFFLSRICNSMQIHFQSNFSDYFPIFLVIRGIFA